jgi:GTP diphosphokinase / guanosine-3',5'-bis(diphosphate) 3'-diphosphatase
MTLLKAIEFASNKHRDQRRKDAMQAPYINHCVRVASITEEIGQITDIEMLMAAVLHDTIEDTQTTEQELASLFGERVLNLVLEMSDDKFLEKQKRKELQIEHAPHVSEDVAPLKLADKISNCEDMLISPPQGWSQERVLTYFEWSEAVIDRLPRVNEGLYQHAKMVIEQGYKQYKN